MGEKIDEGTEYGGRLESKSEKWARKLDEWRYPQWILISYL
jgi:hypothetical protein